MMCGKLPVFTVDEDVYDNRPTLLIGTVDKFAQIVREKRTNGLFGVSDGSPPDLIIQDELHLISGPLGTIAGAYEVAFDLMFARSRAQSKSHWLHSNDLQSARAGARAVRSRSVSVPAAGNRS